MIDNLIEKISNSLGLTKETTSISVIILSIVLILSSIVFMLSASNSNNYSEEELEELKKEFDMMKNLSN